MGVHCSLSHLLDPRREWSSCRRWHLRVQAWEAVGTGLRPPCPSRQGFRSSRRRTAREGYSFNLRDNVQGGRGVGANQLRTRVEAGEGPKRQ